MTKCLFRATNTPRSDVLSDPTQYIGLFFTPVKNAREELPSEGCLTVLHACSSRFFAAVKNSMKRRPSGRFPLVTSPQYVYTGGRN